MGLEVHQELATEHKLFCSCPPKLFKEEPEYTFLRKLRPSQSELGQVDPAALFEFIRGKTIVYEATRETSCLVEMDEEPPGPLNEEALDICLTFALMTGFKPIEEVHVMRKIVVDGSNTCGFQRTCVVALGGAVEAGGKTYMLEQICLEEDAARKMEEEGDIIRYRLDRLGIPLMEISTAPVIRDPEEAETVARRIGSILRATGKVRRGLGTIRQDINVSIKGGSIIEIKGVQDLDVLSKVVKYEAKRQVTLLEIAEELKERGMQASSLRDVPVDVSDIFEDTESRIISDAIKRGHKVYALNLTGFSDLVGREVYPNRRLGTEMADRARYKGGVKGIFHTDELPGYKISAKEVKALREKMAEKVGGTKKDAIIIVADEEEKCHRALSAVLERAIEAIEGVPAETRSANPDGTTYFTRPRPGAARMYPETDVISIPITAERLEKIRDNLPEMPEVTLERLRAEYSLNEKLVKQVFNADYTRDFEELVRETHVDPTLIAVTLTETFKSLARDGVKVEDLRYDVIRDTFALIEMGKTAKESLPQIFTWLAENLGSSPEYAMRTLGLDMLTKAELKRMVEAKVSENMGLVERMGERAFGPLMGMMMSEVRGKALAEDVQALLRKTLASLTDK